VIVLEEQLNSDIDVNLGLLSVCFCASFILARDALIAGIVLANSIFATSNSDSVEAAATAAVAAAAAFNAAPSNINKSPNVLPATVIPAAAKSIIISLFQVFINTQGELK
jgi:hypothetical protein